MGLKIQTIKDINIYLSEELKDLYPASEISAFASIIKTKFNFTKLQMAAYPATAVTPQVSREIMAICRELKTGKPIQYILGETTFYNCTIKVTPAVHSVVVTPHSVFVTPHCASLFMTFCLYHTSS